MFFTFLGVAIGLAIAYWANGSSVKTGLLKKLVTRIQIEMDARREERSRQ